MMKFVQATQLLPRRIRALFCFAGLLGGLAALPGFSQDHVLTSDGSMYTLRIGTEEELFRVGTGLGDRRLLAIDIEHDGTMERLVVPGTQDALEAQLPQIAYLRAADSAFLLWESRVNTLHSQLNLIRYSSSDGFSNISEISGRPFAHRLQTFAHPIVDQVVDLDQTEDRHERALIHIAWLDDSGGTWYLPALNQPSAGLLVGAAVPLHQIFALSEDSSTPNRFQMSVKVGADGRSLLIGRLDRLYGSIERVSLFPVPGHLSELARRLEAEVLEGDPTGTLMDHSDGARATIVNIGRTLEPAMTDALGEEIHRRAAGWTGDPADLRGLASDLRAHVVNIGARLEQFGFTPMPAGTTQILSLSPGGAAADEPQIDLAASLLPQVTLSEPPEPGTGLRLSGDGRRMATFQLVDGVLSYRLFADGSWDQEVTLSRFAGTAIDLQTADDLLGRLLDS